MKLKATDTIHVSSVKSDNILAGEKFDVSEVEAKSLIERGLAVKAEGAAPRNKAEGRSRSNKSAAAKPISGARAR